MALKRRVYARELRAALGYGATWFAELKRRGVISPGHRDPGGKRPAFPQMRLERRHVGRRKIGRPTASGPVTITAAGGETGAGGGLAATDRM